MSHKIFRCCFAAFPSIFVAFITLGLTLNNIAAQSASKTDDRYFGEVPFDFYTRGPYRNNVPKPQQILRFDVGEHHTTYAQMEQVLFAIASAASDRVRVFDLGLTPEYRMMHLVAISSPENISRLDSIREATAKLTDPRKTSPAEADQLIRTLPATAWMAYTIHGNESASFETMMQVIYQLAASEEPQTLDILKNTVVLVVTGENPDGHERFVTWYNSVATGDPDRNAIEHREPWSIYGRLNHYRFNLNRDTLAVTQAETRHMMKAFMEWNPQVAVDHHGQPSQFFFPPVALPINPNLPQPMYNDWLEIYGKANAAAFDAQNWDYYVRDVFDAFYPGYWDTYPSLNGAIGMTYETDGGGFKGLRWMRDDGTIVTFRSAIAKHFVASMTTLEQTAKNREKRLKDFYEFRRLALAKSQGQKMKRVVLIPNDRYKTAELLEILDRMKIEVKQANTSFRSATAHNYLYKNSPAETKNFPAGSYIIDLNQPQGTLIKAILEPDTPQDKAFVEDNMARFRRNQMRGKNQSKEEYGFYDITSWSLPLAFGIEAYWTEDTADVNSRSVDSAAIEQAKRGTVRGRAAIAYLIPYNSDTSAVLVTRLLQKGYRVGVATRQMNAGGRNWPAGTFVVRISRNPSSVHEEIAALAEQLGVDVEAVNSGYATEGDTPVGGEAVYSLQAPRIAVIADEGIDAESYGSIWWTFDRFGV
ncbi:MAG TPA: M14 family zinc carboxypeptidase, partial [Pyrinomonadaceae bacterium]|nr:M14 family zinc carboxypeptidase [Pyrinomonadaceae bacterium]